MSNNTKSHIYIFDGESQSYLKGKPSGFLRNGKQEIKALYDNFSKEKNEISFYIKVTNTSTHSEPWEMKNIQLKLYADKLQKKPIATLRVSDPNAVITEFDKNIQSLENDKKDLIRSIEGLIDIFTKNTADKEKRIENREIEKKKIDDKISALKMEKVEFIASNMMPKRLQSKESTEGLIFFKLPENYHLQKANFILLSFKAAENL